LLAARLRYDYTWKLLLCADFHLHTGDSVFVYRSESLAKTRTEQLVARLRDLQASSGDVEAAAIVSVDGLSIASSLPVGTEEDRVSAMSAAMLSLGERISAELGRGLLQQVFVKGENGYVILTSVGEEAVLTVLARKEAKLGLIFLDVARTVQDLGQLL
jgi:predicted regulator of Ras-like GTPase activity (Roadblock/LC7/MglB family)